MSELRELELAYRAKAEERDEAGYYHLNVPCGMFLNLLEEAEKFRADRRQLRKAARELYYAGRWSCDRAVDEAALWEALRDAAGIPPGAATANGIADNNKALGERLAELEHRFRNEVEGEYVANTLQEARLALAAGSRRAKTPQAVECEASQSGGVAVTPSPNTSPSTRRWS